MTLVYVYYASSTKPQNNFLSFSSSSSLLTGLLEAFDHLTIFTAIDSTTDHTPTCTHTLHLFAAAPPRSPNSLPEDPSSASAMPSFHCTPVLRCFLRSLSSTSWILARCLAFVLLILLCLSVLMAWLDAGSTARPPADRSLAGPFSHPSPPRATGATATGKKGGKKSVGFALEKNEIFPVDRWVDPAVHVHGQRDERRGCIVDFAEEVEYLVDLERWIVPDGRNQIHFPRTKWVRDVPDADLEDDDGDLVMS